MTQIIPVNGGGGNGGGGGSGDMLKSVYDPNNIQADAFDYNNFENTPDLSGYQTKGNLVTNLDSADNTHYPSAKAVADAISSSGGGDMLKSVYDPNNVNANAFDYDNFINTPTIPTKTSDLNNDSGFITGITDGDVITALGYTPYNSTNPSGYVTSSIINDTAYASSWNGDTTHSPTKNAVYDKINSMDTAIGANASAISTINGKIPSAATSSNQLADKDYVNDGINSVTAYYITKDAQGNQWATRAELFAATTFYSGGVVRVPTKNDYTIVLSDEQHDNATTRYIYNSGWEYQYTVNETAMTQAQLDALNSGITSGKVSTYDGYAATIAGKQDALVSGTNIKTVNSTSLLGSGNVAVQPTLVSGTNIKTVNSTSLLGSGNIAVQPTLVSGTNIKTVNSTSLLGSGNISINGFNPGGTATTGYVVTKTANGYEWAAPSGGIEVDANSPIQLTKIRAGTQAQYDALGSYDSTTVYLTI